MYTTVYILYCGGQLLAELIKYKEKNIFCGWPLIFLESDHIIDLFYGLPLLL
jgi:hypothetical protein